jgi:hypothetical protein
MFSYTSFTSKHWTSELRIYRRTKDVYYQPVSSLYYRNLLLSILYIIKRVFLCRPTSKIHGLLSVEAMFFQKDEIVMFSSTAIALYDYD